MQESANNVLPLEPAKPSAAVVVITPDIAARWLELNTRNRPIRERTVDAYARDIQAGRWQITGEAIKFAADGSLLDGQHRLCAVAKAGVPVPMFVVRGLRPEAQDAMDTGARRSAADALALHGERAAPTLASAARIAIGIERTGRPEKIQVTHGEVTAFIDANPDLREAARFAKGIARKTDCTPSFIAYTTWRLAQIDRQQAYQFWIDVAEKVGLAAGDPVLALAARFAEARRGGAPLKAHEVLSAVYRAWNARREGRPLRIIKVNSPSGGPVPIPEPQ